MPSRLHLGSIDPRLQHLVDRALEGAEILRVVPLKADTVEHGTTAKSAGYGAPLRLDIRHDGRENSR